MTECCMLLSLGPNEELFVVDSSIPIAAFESARHGESTDNWRLLKQVGPSRLLATFQDIK
jgi:hypothetical protein